MTRDEIDRMARSAGIARHGLGWTCWEGQLERFAALVEASARADEREACAKVCDAADKSTHPADLADAIRARKDNT